MKDFASCPALRHASISLSGKANSRSGLRKFHVDLPFAQLRSLHYDHLGRGHLVIEASRDGELFYDCADDRHCLEWFFARFQDPLPPTTLRIALWTPREEEFFTATWFEHQLTLPTLQHLDVGGYLNPLPFVVPFLRRSRCPLRKFSVNVFPYRSATTTEDLLPELLSLCPDLEELDCTIASPEDLQHFILDTSVPESSIPAHRLQKLQIIVLPSRTWSEGSALQQAAETINKIAITRSAIIDNFQCTVRSIQQPDVEHPEWEGLSLWLLKRRNPAKEMLQGNWVLARAERWQLNSSGHRTVKWICHEAQETD